MIDLRFVVCLLFAPRRSWGFVHLFIPGEIKLVFIPSSPFSYFGCSLFVSFTVQ
jgi:hypothetical protein